jgi:hypothetical protein
LEEYGATDLLPLIYLRISRENEISLEEAEKLCTKISMGSNVIPEDISRFEVRLYEHGDKLAVKQFIDSFSQE